MQSPISVQELFGSDKICEYVYLIFVQLQTFESGRLTKIPITQFKFNVSAKIISTSSFRKLDATNDKLGFNVFAF